MKKALKKAIEDIAYEAYMIGRAYAVGGEKESPGEMHDKLLKMIDCKLKSVKAYKERVSMESNKNVTITLSMNVEEARFIRGLVQNPIGCTPDEEDSCDAEIRHRIYEALNIDL